MADLVIWAALDGTVECEETTGGATGALLEDLLADPQICAACAVYDAPYFELDEISYFAAQHGIDWTGA